YSVFASSRVRTISSNLASAPHGLERDDRLDEIASARKHRVLERARRGDDAVACGDTPDGLPQIAPGELLHAGGDLGADTAGQRALLGRDQDARARDGLEDGVEVEWEEAGEHDNLAEDLVLEDQLRGRVERDRGHAPVRDDRRRSLREAVARERERG